LQLIGIVWLKNRRRSHAFKIQKSPEIKKRLSF
jgi:hypothetical protein